MVHKWRLKRGIKLGADCQLWVKSEHMGKFQILVRFTFNYGPEKASSRPKPNVLGADLRRSFPEILVILLG